jgi:lipopolysaccharide transport protein LptA
MKAMLHFVALWLVLSGVSYAETMTVDADRFEVNREAKHGVFTGNVVLVRPDLTLRCARLEGNFGKSNAPMLATGGVVIVRQGSDGTETAKGTRAEYSTSTGFLVMVGNVTLTQGGHTLVGDRLEYDVKAGKARLTSASKVRATIKDEGN